MFRSADVPGHRNRTCTGAVGVAALLLSVPIASQATPPGTVAQVANISAAVVDVFGGTAELDGSTTVERTTTGTRSRIDCTVLFAKDSDRLRPGARATLDRLALELLAQGPGRVKITGYTDDLGSAAHGLDLSQRRAEQVARQLRHRLSVTKFPMEVLGLGEAHPAVPNTNEANRRKNRRVVVTLTRIATAPPTRVRGSEQGTTPANTPTPLPSSTTPSPTSAAPAAPTSAAAAAPPPPLDVPTGVGTWPLVAGAAALLIGGGVAADRVARRRQGGSPAVPDPVLNGPGAPSEDETEGNLASISPANHSAVQVAVRPDTSPAAELAEIAGHLPPPGLGPSQTADPGRAASAGQSGPILVGARLRADLAAWSHPDTTRPRLTLLGPVAARTSGQALARRKPYYTELLAFLALKPHGAVVDEVAESFHLTSARVRTDMKMLRDWLGHNPASGRPYLPDARDSTAARQRGHAVYQVDGVLCDWQLFQELTKKASQVEGEQQIKLLQDALALVGGRPLDRLRPHGWDWATTSSRLDQEIICAIVAAAHTVTVHHRDRGDVVAAQRAARIARSAAPDEDGPRRDLADVNVRASR